MIYRVHLYDEQDGSFGFRFFTRKRDAQRALRAWQKDSPALRSCRTARTIDCITTPRTQEAVLALLRRWAQHEQNG